MTTRTLHPFLQRVAALAILGVVIGLAIVSIAAPVLDAMDERNAALDRLARYQAAASRRVVKAATYNPEDLAATRLDQAEAQLALQTGVDRVARTTGVAVQSMQPLSAEYLGEMGSGAWLELNFSGDLQALTAFLANLNAERPLLVVRRIEIDRGEGPRPDIFLRVRVQIGQVWRPLGSAR